MSIWESFWAIMWWFLWAFVFVSYLMVLFGIIADIFRDRSLSGWLKAIWMIFLVFVPFLTAVVYLIARGSGMSERSASVARDSQNAAETYIRSVAGSSPSDEIDKAAKLLAAGTITNEEFASIKARVLR